MGQGIYGLDRFKATHWQRLEETLKVNRQDTVKTPSRVHPDENKTTKHNKLQQLFKQRASIVADDPYL